MRKFILGCLGAVTALVAVQLAQAEVKAGVFSDCSPCEVAACDPCDAACNPCDAICGKKKSLWFLSGHVEAGLFANEYGQTDIYGSDFDYAYGSGLLYPGNSPYLRNAQQTSFVMNQMYITGGKKLSKRGWDVGGTASVMYGTDARYAQSQGLEYGAGRGAWDSGDYYTALAQAFVEVGYNNVSVKAGKFWNPMGHNSLVSTERFFYTLTDAFAALPVTQSGILATWDVNKKLSVFGGWTSGTGTYDAWGMDNTGDMFFDSKDNNAFLGGARYALNKRVALAYSVMIGTDNTKEWKDKEVGLGWNELGDGRDYFVQSFVADVKLNKKWNYTFEWTLRNEKWKNAEVYYADADNYGGAGYKDFWGAYGINQELIYRYNSKWAFGGRIEWMHSYYTYDWARFNQDGAIDAGHDSAVSGMDKFSFSLGANWTPRSWIVVRPELRYDKFEHERNFYEKGGDAKKDQLSGGCSAIVKF